MYIVNSQMRGFYPGYEKVGQATMKYNFTLKLLAEGSRHYTNV